MTKVLHPTDLEWSPAAIQALFEMHIKPERCLEQQSEPAQPFVIIEDPIRSGWALEVFVTESFTQILKKRRLSKDNRVWRTFRNINRGSTSQHGHSRGGRDGIFLVTEDFKPKNSMVAKLFDRYLRNSTGLGELRLYLEEPEQALGVRVVSHHFRLLGFLESDEEKQSSRLVLVNIDP